MSSAGGIEKKHGHGWGQQDYENGYIGPVEPQAFGGNNTSGSIDVSTALLAQPGSGWKGDFESETFVAFKASHYTRGKDGAPSEVFPPLSADADKGDQDPLVLVPFDTTQVTSPENYSNPKPGDPCHPLAAGAHAPAIAGTMTSNGDPHSGFKEADGVVQHSAAVRRLMPVECERLQGFPDGYTAITYRGKPAADGPRYKALGNSWAVNCARWVGWRIAMVDALQLARREAP